MPPGGVPFIGSFVNPSFLPKSCRLEMGASRSWVRFLSQPRPGARWRAAPAFDSPGPPLQYVSACSLAGLLPGCSDLLSSARTSFRLPCVAPPSRATAYHAGVEKLSPSQAVTQSVALTSPEPRRLAWGPLAFYSRRPRSCPHPLSSTPEQDEKGRRYVAFGAAPRNFFRLGIGHYFSWNK